MDRTEAPTFVLSLVRRQLYVCSDKLTKILVRRDNCYTVSIFLCLSRVCSNQIVRLVTFLLDCEHAESDTRTLNKSELRR